MHIFLCDQIYFSSIQQRSCRGAQNEVCSVTVKYYQYPPPKKDISDSKYAAHLLFILFDSQQRTGRLVHFIHGRLVLTSEFKF